MYPFVHELFRMLHEHHYKIAIITNGTSDLSMHPELESLVDVFVNPDVCGDSKPSTTPFFKVGLLHELQSQEGYGNDRNLRFEHVHACG